MAIKFAIVEFLMPIIDTIAAMIPAGFALHRVEQSGDRYGLTYRDGPRSIRITTGMTPFAPQTPAVTRPRLLWCDDIDAQACYESTFHVAVDGTALHGACCGPSEASALQIVTQVAQGFGRARHEVGRTFLMAVPAERPQPEHARAPERATKGA